MPKQETGIVVATRGRMFDVLTSTHARIRCELRQKVKHFTEGETPVTVGDDVVITVVNERSGVIDAVKERRSAFFRPAKLRESQRQVIAANLDQLAVVASVKSPALSTGLIDRMLIAAELGHLAPIVIINKVDLGETGELVEVVRAYRAIGYPTLTVSAKKSVGIEEVRSQLAGHRTIFAGHSGVGKSTLLNVLDPGLDLKTREVADGSQRGKHTTTTIELFELPSGGFAADSPGLRVMGLWELDQESLPEYYRDFGPHTGACRFQPCSHTHEPGCGVKLAVERGEVSRFRYENYLAIASTLDAEP